jgi:hypothetical protein
MTMKTVNTMKIFGIASLLLAVAAVGLGLAASAGAKDRPEVRVNGTCTGPSTSKLKLHPDDGRLETEFEVDQNRVGQRWRVVLTRNGKVAARTVRRTKAPSGSFELRRMLRDGAGRDRVIAQARNLRTGERCRASAAM